MNKKIVAAFLKDRMGFTFSYFLSNVLLGVFYSISTGSRVEILYPALLSAFIYLAAMTVGWFRYSTFYSGLKKCIEDIHYELLPSTCEQKEASLAISRIHRYYMDRIQEINGQALQHKHFISQWIHNMKTPVSVIDLVLQRASRGEIAGEVAFADIREENLKLLNHLEQVLSLLRLEDFSGDYVPESLDLALAVKKIINSRKNQFIHSKVFPRLEAPGEPVPVLTDSKWNEVLLDQIVSNAIKYSGDGESPKNVYFTIERQEGRVLLKIRDEGVGIPQHDLRRVFEPFFTGENGRKYKNATGIGLYLSRMIAEKLGHTLELRSRQGEGTEVTVSYLSKV